MAHLCRPTLFFRGRGWSFIREFAPLSNKSPRARSFPDTHTGLSFPSSFLPFPLIAQPHSSPHKSLPFLLPFVNH